jgi:cold shock CspA family protein
MATGKVLQFDPIRGYGFVAADDGGEDVFLHASVFDGDPGDLVPGRSLEFQVMAGDRGRKAFGARFTGVKEPALVPSPALSTGTLSTGTLSTGTLSTGRLSTLEEDQMCDVLSQAEFGTEITELLLRTIPALTGAQILEVRQGMFEFAKTRGWIDA